ncbi:Ribonuclease H-like domain-containing protein [Strongyloides ratti]|uniref:RNA-directed DNA polymerase n=1 Tax=Strongyloides ratti TaxID=34506 RepID=A0A090MQ47_STRRB|nr:Ribonuclease H-like domain-containing protein [Strongyloides ratti]CEF60263.1 Ribonuclease H-like domain-containing protein [Strongyloides ratti]
MVVALIEAAPLDMNEIREANKKDKLLKEVISWLVSGVYQDGILFKEARIVVPQALQSKVLNQLHHGHVGMVRMKLYARGMVFWIGLSSDIEKTAGKCQTCLEYGQPNKNLNLHPWKPTNQVGKRLHIDILGPLEGDMYLAAYDVHSKYPWIEKLGDTSSACIKKKLEEIFLQIGAPELIVSDNCANFKSKELMDNGSAENLVRKFKTTFKRLRMDEESKESAVKIFLKVCRGVPSVVTGKASLELMCGRKQLFFKKSKEVKEEKVRFKNVMVKTKADKKWKRGIIKSKVGVNLYKVMVEGKEQLKHADQIRKRRLDTTPLKRIRRAVSHKTVQLNNLSDSVAKHYAGKPVATSGQVTEVIELKKEDPGYETLRKTRYLC